MLNKLFTIGIMLMLGAFLNTASANEVRSGYDPPPINQFIEQVSEKAELQIMEVVDYRASEMQISDLVIQKIDYQIRDAMIQAELIALEAPTYKLIYEDTGQNKGKLHYTYKIVNKRQSLIKNIASNLGNRC